MNIDKSTKIFLWGIAALVIIAGCSPSSSGTRYNNPPQKTEEKEKKSAVRFTSKDKTTSSKKNNPPSQRYFNQPEFDETPVEDHPVDTEMFKKKFEKFGQLSAALTPREKILFEIVGFLDTPYLYGGEGEEGIDCSAFTQKVMNNTLGIELPRSASQQYKIGEKVSNKSELNFGDLIFFDTRTGSYPGHVGIYIGENMFAHASRSKGVTISSLESTYYKNRFIGAKRITKDIEQQ